MGAALLLAAQLLSGAAALCVFTQDCAGDPNAGCHPYNITPSPPKPLLANETGFFGIVCPQFAANSCCNAVQNQLLYVNFMLVHSYFGDTAEGGCPACEQNLRDLWCSYTCSPEQDRFVTPQGLTQVVNPTSGVLTTVLATSVRVGVRYACSIFGSCSATAKVKTYSPMASCEGLLAYQGGTGAIPEGAYLTFDYSGKPDGSGTSPAALDLPTSNCCSFPANFSAPGAGNTSCPCASCSGCCAGGTCYGGVQPAAASGAGINISLDSLGDPGLSVWTGFQGWAVGGLYGALALLSACVAGVRVRSLTQLLPARLSRALMGDGEEEKEEDGEGEGGAEGEEEEEDRQQLGRGPGAGQRPRQQYEPPQAPDR